MSLSGASVSRSGEAAPACGRAPMPSFSNARRTTAEFAISTTSPVPRRRSPRSQIPPLLPPRCQGNASGKIGRLPLVRGCNSSGIVSRAFIIRAPRPPRAQARPLLERFRAKWKPVRIKKTRQTKNLEFRFDSIETEQVLGCVAAFERFGCGVVRYQELAFECGCRHRPAEEIALSLFASHAHQQIGGGPGLDAFRDHRQAQLPGKTEGPTDDRRIVGTRAQRTHEFPVRPESIAR